MTKECKNCKTQFEIASEDLTFYDKISPTINGKKYQMPTPTLCPACRQQRRLAYRNERTLYNRNCSATNQPIISIYKPETSFQVYYHEYFFSDKWNPLDYGQDYNFNRSFFDQYKDLQSIVPRVANYCFANDNADYGNLSSWNKDCYMCFEADMNRDCYHCDYTYRCKNCVDCSYTTESELCYFCIGINNSYNLNYAINCKNCSDSSFLADCISCKNCFGCINLYAREYCFFNQRLTLKQYKQEVAKYPLTQNSFSKFQSYFKQFPHKYLHGVSNENCIGDYLDNCKNAQYCFDSSRLHDCKFVYNSEKLKDCYDIESYGGLEGTELAYECHSVGRSSFNVCFGNNIYQKLVDSYYCDHCVQSKNLFGCISLRSVKFCILNKQYSETEYYQMLEKIIPQMTANGEWGEFFSLANSPFDYHETVAQIYYPIGKETCFTDRPFNIPPAELSFYQNKNLPVPEKHPNLRYAERFALRNPRKLYKIKCLKCNIELLSTFNPVSKETILCEKCFRENVY